MLFLTGPDIPALLFLHIGFPLLVWEPLESKGQDIFFTDIVKGEVCGVRDTWVSYLTSINFSFLISKMGVMIPSP